MPLISHHKLNAVWFAISAFNTLSICKFMVFCKLQDRMFAAIRLFIVIVWGEFFVFIGSAVSIKCVNMIGCDNPFENYLLRFYFNSFVFIIDWKQNGETFRTFTYYIIQEDTIIPIDIGDHNHIYN